MAGLVKPPIGGEDAPHAEQRQGDHEEARDRAAAHGDLDRLDQAALRRRGRAHVRLDGDEHADDARGHRAGGADQEGDAGHEAELEPEDVGVGDLRGLDDADDHADDHGAGDGQHGDGRVLATDERDGALEDGAGHVLHGLRALVAAEDVARQVEREEDRDDARDRDDPLQRRRDLHGG